MEKRFIVKNVVSDYGVFDTQYGDGERLECICSAKANADLIADILNADYSKPNECSYYENELQQKNKQLKEQLIEQRKQIDILWEALKIGSVDASYMKFCIEKAKESLK